MGSKTPDFDVMDDAMATVLREKTEQERLEIGFGMWHFARTMIREVVRAEHPNWTDEAIQRQVAKRMSHGAV
ncbi:MAG: hypothetical protein JW888_15820 [Pirellulales bacterium]|nr:hypothetical protein [Pirellulales bacterium]